MTITDYNFLQKLKTEKISCSVVPVTVKNSVYFQNLLSTNVILLEGNWKRGSIKLNENEKDYFNTFLKNNFPSEITQQIDRATNIKSLRNSKSRKTESNIIVFLRGNQQIKINGIEVDLALHTHNFGLFSTVLESLVCDKICFVENLYSFLNVEKLITDDYIFVHTYGRLGEKLLDKIQTNEVLVFSDYDFVGLNEYLKFKEKFTKTTFFVPENYHFLFQTYSRPLKDTQKETSQKPSERVQNSTDEVAIKIRNQIFETQHFLEQEILTSL
ncbi:MAG: hypothetical protein EAZ44_02015 [Cytophagia bacterium]|nr:MAG: hypothetical protein EAZ44_02015 [Cytophagia bacterium]